MTRRTISIPDSVDQLIKELREEGESYSATVTRLVEGGARSAGKRRKLSFVGIGEGPEDFGINAEKYLRELAKTGSLGELSQRSAFLARS